LQKQFFPVPDGFEISNPSGTRKNGFLQLSRDPVIEFQISFFYFEEDIEGHKIKKKFIEIPLLDHKITLFNAFNFFPRIYIVTLCRS